MADLVVVTDEGLEPVEVIFCCKYLGALGPRLVGLAGFTLPFARVFWLLQESLFNLVGLPSLFESSDSLEADLLVITELFMLSFMESSTHRSDRRSLSEDLLVLDLLPVRALADVRLSKDMLLVDLMLAATLPLRCFLAAGLEWRELSLDECW